MTAVFLCRANVEGESELRLVGVYTVLGDRRTHIPPTILYPLSRRLTLTVKCDLIPIP